MALDQCRSHPPMKLPQYLSVINTPLEWTMWVTWLQGHPDRMLVDYIIRGLREGFRIGFNGSTESVHKAACNMLSATKNPEVIQEYLLKECTEGRIIGPLPISEFPMIHICCFGVIPKGSSGRWHLIVDLSAPEGYSVNDGIREDLCSLKYVTVDDAVQVVLELGQGAKLTKLDICSAYRIIPVNPEDRWLLGMSWDGALYINTTLPFGLCSALKMFNAVTDTIEWIIRQQGVAPVFHYLDDFLLIGHSGTGQCGTHLSVVLSIFNKLGILITQKKVEEPSTTITFLGIEINTVAMQLRLPYTKLTELRGLVSNWILRKSCLKKDLQSLAGKLQHACKVLRPGKTFLQRVFDLLRVTVKKHHHIHLNKDFQSDSMWWDTFLSVWNGVSMFQGLSQVQQVPVFTDVSGELGCRGWWGTQWFQYMWLPTGKFRDLPITQKEVLPVVMAGAVWGQQWHSLMVQVFCDNEVAVEVLSAKYSRDPQIMHLLRCLFFIKACFQLELRMSLYRVQITLKQMQFHAINFHYFSCRYQKPKYRQCE